MKKQLFTAVVILIISISLVSLSSCEFLRGDLAENDLIGTWTIDDASGKITVAGINITQVLIATYGYANDSAQVFLDSLISEFSEGLEGSITFNDDYSYEMSFGSIEDEAGTWSMDEDKYLVSLTVSGGMTAKFLEVQSLSENSLILELPAEEANLDLNQDGTEETKVDIVMELSLSK